MECMFINPNTPRSFWRSSSLKIVKRWTLQCILPALWAKKIKDPKLDQKLYRGMIGSLLYLTASRPDILFSVCLCARFQSDPREPHLTAVKRIFWYLKGTTNLGLLYKKSSDYKLVGFCDANYASDRIERKSTSGNCQFLGDNLIPWASKRQATIALSTVKAEYISAACCCTQLLWMKHHLEDYEIIENCIPIYCDNTATTCLSKNPILHSRANTLKLNILSETMFKKEL